MTLLYTGESSYLDEDDQFLKPPLKNRIISTFLYISLISGENDETGVMMIHIDIYIYY